jgi:hypothetical protein
LCQIRGIVSSIQPIFPVIYYLRGFFSSIPGMPLAVGFADYPAAAIISASVGPIPLITTLLTAVSEKKELSMPTRVIKAGTESCILSVRGIYLI